MNDNEAVAMMSSTLQQVVRGLTGIEEICKGAAKIEGLSDTVRVPVALVDSIAIPTPGVITVPGDQPEVEIPSLFYGSVERVDVTDPNNVPKVEDHPDEKGITQEELDKSAAGFKDKIGGRSLIMYFQDHADDEPTNGLGSALLGRKVQGMVALTFE